MKLDLRANNLVLTDSDKELKPNQKSQLVYWGFHKESDDIYISSAEDLGSFVEKISSYLQYLRQIGSKKVGLIE